MRIGKCVWRFLGALCCLLWLLAGVARAAAPELAAYRAAYFRQVAAAMCLGVYSGNRSGEFDYLNYYGWQIEPEILQNGTAEPHFAIAANHFNKLGKNIYLVTFRGSASRKDWRINLKTERVAYGGTTLREMEKVAAQQLKDERTPSVHAGFNTYVNTLLKYSVLDAEGHLQGVFAKVAASDENYLILTGHSLGGAAATLLGARLLDLGLPPERFRVITFGAPAVGNAGMAELYDGRLELERVTNSLDPVPGSLQTFFGGYKQFGKQLKYAVSPRSNDWQHDMALYFDCSVSACYLAEDAAVAAQVLEPAPTSQVAPGVPLVAVLVTNTPAIAKHEYLPELERFLRTEYLRALPSYQLITPQPQHLSEAELLRACRRAGAAYLLLVTNDGRQPADSKYWYLSLEQSLYTTEGQLLTLASFGKKVSPAAGNIQAAGDNFLAARAELAVYLPFLKKSQGDAL